jgi:hypothetical protein
LASNTTTVFPISSSCRCITDWGQCGYTDEAASKTSGTYKKYLDNTCKTLESSVTTYTNTSCALNDDYDDDIFEGDGYDDDNYTPTMYYIKYYQGYPNSNDDDDNVSLSQAA